jgi:aspartyl-tRNA(Asn)/glutamyl-tRNA(Gln) amidotransferase subunit C
MKLSEAEIQHIADLARLELSEAEKEIYGKQLSHILDYIDQLKEVNTAGIEPTAQVTGLENVYREDRIVGWKEDEVESALKQSPEIEGEQIKVKRIL